MSGCYHIWRMADSGNGMFRIRRCFKSASTARTTATRGVTGDRDKDKQTISLIMHKGKPQFQVLKCLGFCPCGPGKNECGRGVDND